MSKAMGYLLPIGISSVGTPVIAQGGIENSASSTQLTYATSAGDSGWDVVMPDALQPSHKDPLNFMGLRDHGCSLRNRIRNDTGTGG